MSRTAWGVSFSNRILPTSVALFISSTWHTEPVTAVNHDRVRDPREAVIPRFLADNRGPEAQQTGADEANGLVNGIFLCLSEDATGKFLDRAKSSSTAHLA